MPSSDLSDHGRAARARDYDRWLCASFAPDAVREDLYVLLAANAEIARVPDAVSEPTLGRIRLQWWREALETPPAGHPLAEALADCVSRRGLEQEGVGRLLDARARDLEDFRPATLAELEGHAGETGGEITALMLGILSAPEAIEAGRSLGTGWALVGTLRALGFEARARRCHLPQDLCREAGFDVGRFLDGREAQGLPQVARALADAARRHLEDARARRREVPRKALPALLPARLLDGYLKRLEKIGFDPLNPALQRFGISRPLRAAWGLALGRF